MWKKLSTVGNPFRRLTVTMVIFVVCCIILPLTVCNRIIYLRTMEQFDRELISRIQSETCSYAELLEQELQSIRMQTYSILSDQTVNSLPVQFETGELGTDFAQKLKIVQSRMQAVQDCHGIIENMAIYYPQFLRKITSGYQKIYTEKDENIEQYLLSGHSSDVWSDSDRVIFFDKNNISRRVESENIRVAIKLVISSKTMKTYLQNFGNRASACFFAVGMDENRENSFFSSSGSLLSTAIVTGHAADQDGYSVIGLEQGKYLLTHAELGNHMVFYQLTPFDDVRLPLREYETGVLSYMIVLVCLIVLFALIFGMVILKPVSHARQVISRMEKGELGITMGKTWYAEFQKLYDQFDSMSKRIQCLIEQEYELRMLNAKAQMKQLQYQINPHFLYNTYFTLRGLLQEEEYDDAAKLSDIMGKYLRYITVSDCEVATLKEEIGHAGNYAGIQQLRFSRRVSVSFAACPPGLGDFRVPRLIIQPLIENAFEHGVRNKISDGIIQVNILEFSGGFSVSVEDNGDGMDQDGLKRLSDSLMGSEQPYRDSVALFNIHKRLILMYGEGSGLYVSRSRLGGLCCEIRILYAGGAQGAQDTCC